jgi:hypothetical protein
MRRLSVTCWIAGHDDRFKRTASRVYLECAECGRKTPGWELSTERPGRLNAPGRAHAESGLTWIAAAVKDRAQRLRSTARGCHRIFDLIVHKARRFHTTGTR